MICNCCCDIKYWFQRIVFNALVWLYWNSSKDSSCPQRIYYLWVRCGPCGRAYALQLQCPDWLLVHMLPVAHGFCSSAVPAYVLPSWGPLGGAQPLNIVGCPPLHNKKKDIWHWMSSLELWDYWCQFRVCWNTDFSSLKSSSAHP